MVWKPSVKKQFADSNLLISILDELLTDFISTTPSVLQQKTQHKKNLAKCEVFYHENRIIWIMILLYQQLLEQC